MVKNIRTMRTISWYDIKIFAQGWQVSIVKSIVKTIFFSVYHVYIFTLSMSSPGGTTFGSLNEIKIFIEYEELQTNKSLHEIIYAKPSYLSGMGQRDSAVICIV